jgi:hypothetical protein
MRERIGSLKKINKFDKPSTIQIKRNGEKIKINRIRGERQQTPYILVKSQGLLGSILKTYTLINWKI